MNKIAPPAHNDADAIDSIASNHKLNSHPHFKPAVVAKLKTGYLQYVNAEGNAFHVASVHLSTVQKQHLRELYKSPPTAIGYIDELRERTGHLLCPMCGSTHSGTLDHVLPQNNYPEFAIFSQNLVPACKCNSSRQNIFRGSRPSERVLHPYFDACLADRLIKAHFDNLGPIPTISLHLAVTNSHPNYAAIVFHVDKVVMRTSIGYEFHTLWGNLCRRPGLIIPKLDDVNPSTIDQLRVMVEQELGRRDDFHGGKNNWISAFVAGLLDNAVLTWLFGQLSKPTRNVAGPLF